MPSRAEGTRGTNPDPVTNLGYAVLLSAPWHRLGSAWWNGAAGRGKPQPWDGEGAWAEWGRGVTKHPSKLVLLIFFFPQSLAPLLGAKPADTDGVLQNRAKRQERKEQSYL